MLLSLRLHKKKTLACLACLCCVKGIPLSPIDVRFIVDRCKNLQLMEMSHGTDERDDECRLLASECDVSLFIY